MAKRVLIIEDEPDIQDIERMVLEEMMGYETALASTGQEGLDRAVAMQPDLIVLDLMLPDINGFEVASKLSISFATMGHRPSIVALSGLSSPEDKERAREAGCNVVLEKPFDLEDFMDKVRQVMDAGSSVD